MTPTPVSPKLPVGEVSAAGAWRQGCSEDVEGCREWGAPGAPSGASAVTATSDRVPGSVSHLCSFALFAVVASCPALGWAYWCGVCGRCCGLRAPW